MDLVPTRMGWPVPPGAKKTDRVWVADRFHNRVTNREIGPEAIRYGAFPSCTLSVRATEAEVFADLLAYRQLKVAEAERELARAKRSLKSAQKAHEEYLKRAAWVQGEIAC